MFRQTNPQVSLLECQFLLPEEKLNRLKRTWAEPFQKRILPLIDEDVFRDAFSEDNGRPNKSIRLLVGLHLLKECEDLTDEQVIEQLEYNLQWNYALAVQPADAHTCQKTLHNFRVRLMENDRARKEFEQLTGALAEADGLSLGRQRLDSTHVISNMAVLTRLGLFTETVTNFMKELRREAPEKLSGLESGYEKRYLEREGYFADAKREQARRRLPVVAKDVMHLVRAFENDKEVRELESYQMLARLFEEQCEVEPGEEPAAVQIEDIISAGEEVEESHKEEEEGGQRKSAEATVHDKHTKGEMAEPAVEKEEQEQLSVRLKEGREVSSDSLQSPHDPDATYGHKGKGYEVQVAETCEEDNPYQIITGLAVGVAHESDHNALIPMVKQLDDSGMKPDELLADTSYGSGQNIIDCAKMGVNLQAPVHDPDAPESPDHWDKPVESCAPQNLSERPEQTAEPGAQSDDAGVLDLDAFSFNETYEEVLACPAGHAPTEQHLTKGGGLICATFSGSHCHSCPFAKRCPTRLKKSGDRILRCSPAKAATAHRQLEQESQEFKERYKKRSGIESTNAELKGCHGADDIRVRGRPRLTLAMQLKTLALNVKRAVQYHTEKIKEMTAPDLSQVPVMV